MTDRSAAGAPQHLVVMGISGGGKTTIATLLSERLGYVFAEGDEFHPEANREKMAAGRPLDDADRLPWLGAIADWMSAQARVGRSTVVTCSALRRSYRDVLRAADGEEVFIHLAPPAHVTLERMRQRRGHYMPPSLLDSQLATLEELGDDERGFRIDTDAPTEEVLETVLAALDGVLSGPPGPGAPR